MSYIEHKNPERKSVQFCLACHLVLFTFKKSPLPTYRPYLRLPPHGGSVVVPTTTTYVPTYEYLYTTLHLQHYTCSFLSVKNGGTCIRSRSMWVIP